MYRLAVEFPLFYGNEREDAREFIDNYSRAGKLNGWDEEKLALGLPLFLKHEASVWFKTLSEAENESFQVLSQKLISHFESSVTLWQVRQKLEERRQLLEETVADYYHNILSFCSRLNSLPKSEWFYCFVRGLRSEIRDHGILQLPTDVDSAHRRTGNFLPGGAVDHLPKRISQVAQIFPKESKRNEGHIATT